MNCLRVSILALIGLCCLAAVFAGATVLVLQLTVDGLRGDLIAFSADHGITDMPADASELGDMAPTLSRLLDISPPAAAQGEALYEAVAP